MLPNVMLKQLRSHEKIGQRYDLVKMLTINLSMASPLFQENIIIFSSTFFLGKFSLKLITE